MASNTQKIVTGIAAGLVFCSAALLGFLGRWEGDKVYTVYADRLAGGLPTVCKGLTRHITDTAIVVGEVWTEAKCDAEERKAVTKVQTALLRCFRLTPPQSVFDAASSHAWNVGVSLTCGSQAMAAWNRGEWALGCRRLEFSDGGRRVWSSVKTGRMVRNAAGKLVPEYRYVAGLANRRGGEHALCMRGVVP